MNKGIVKAIITKHRNGLRLSAEEKLALIERKLTCHCKRNCRLNDTPEDFKKHDCRNCMFGQILHITQDRYEETWEWGTEDE